MTDPFLTAIAAVALSAAALVLPAAADPAPGMSRLADTGDAGRPLALSVWYPSVAEASASVGGNAVFLGVPASSAILEEGAAMPLVVLSHGGLRSAPDSGAWLAAALAGEGFIVVEVNAPRPVTAGDAVDEIWRRPADISNALDLILADPVWGGRINRDAISVVGHALGATAALAAAGAELDLDLYRAPCAAPVAQGPDCAWFAANGTGLGDADPAELARSRYDARVSRIVAINAEYLDLLGQPDERSEVQALFLSLGTAAVTIWQGSQSLALRDATAFDAFAPCTAAGADILQGDGEDPALCATTAGQRAIIHDKIADAVIGFLAGAGKNSDPRTP